MMKINLNELTENVCQIAEAASAIILRHYAGEMVVEKKADHSPVTAADKESNDYIVQALQRFTPDITVISEEGEQLPAAADAPFWLVDPLDGTRSYIARDGQFTVNIALIQKRRPVLGVIAIPAEAMLYYAAEGQGASRRHFATQLCEAEKIQCRIPSAEGVEVVTSKSHGSPKMLEFLAGHPVIGRVRAGSALKFCRVAEGVADIYPRMGETMEWDTAAGQCILEEAGGIMTDLQGQPFLYGKKDFLNPGFVAWGNQSLVASFSER